MQRGSISVPFGYSSYFAGGGGYNGWLAGCAGCVLSSLQCDIGWPRKLPLSATMASAYRGYQKRRLYLGMYPLLSLLAACTAPGLSLGNIHA